MSKTFRQMLNEAAADQKKAVALEAGLATKAETAQSELSRILSGESNERVFRVIEAIYKFGKREYIRKWHEERLKPQDPASTLAEIGEQLDLLEHKFELVREAAKELAEVIPLKRG